MIEHRDEELGAILDQIDVLEHGLGYWETVLNAAEPELARLRADAGEAGGPREVDERQKPRRHPIAALIERYPTFGGGFRVPIWLGVALVAAIVAVTLVGLPRDGGDGVTGPQPATAAEAIRLSLDVLQDAEAVEGTARTYDNGITENGETVLSLANTFLATRDGSVRLESIPGEGAYYPGVFGPDAKSITVYDASTRRFQYLLDAGPDGTVSSVEAVAAGKHSRYQWYEHEHAAPGPPDGPQRLDDLPLWRLRAYLRTLLSTPGVELDVQSIDGRPSWVVKAPWVVGGGTYRATIAIDATTRLPYELEYRLGNRVNKSYFDIAVRDAPVDPGAFRIQEPPAGETERRSPGGDFMYTFLDLPVADAGQARRRTKSMPVLPSWVPRGFALCDATVTNGRESVFIVSLVYRRGFDQVTVTTRPDPRLFGSSWNSVNGSTPVRTDTSNPFIPEMGPQTRAAWDAQTIRVRLTSGAFADRTARVITDPGHWPHLWVKKNGCVATVAGDLTVGQMKRVAESLGPWQGDDDN